ncbi:hypothetical protein JCM8208_003767 [Rhodotorula glutinis]
MTLNSGYTGRRPSALGDPAAAPRPENIAIPPSPFLNDYAPSPRFPTTPRFGGAGPTTPRHGRKSSAGPAYPASPGRGWSSWMSWVGFGGGGDDQGGAGRDTREKSGTLPTYGKRAPLTPRPFYSDGGRSSSAGAAAGGPLVLVRNLVLRPIYLLGRRGPILPIVGFVIVLLCYLSYSTSPSSQSVKLRVQGAVGPYIPQRAADAIRWHGSDAQRPLPGGAGRGDLLDSEGLMPVERKQVVHPLRPEDLPPVGTDSRLPLEEGKPHPIPAMMKRAKKQWEDLKARQSSTFAEAVNEYKRRHGRNPPKGFDKWYAFAKAHEVLLIDEFDLIEKDLLMYRAFPPRIFRKRVANIPETMDTTWTIRLERGRILREGPLAHHDRAKGVESLMNRFAAYLPDMTVIYNGHDNARIAVAAEERIRLETLARAGEFDDDENPPFEPKERGPFPNWGYTVFCPPESPARELGFEKYGYHADLDSTGFEMPPHPEGSIGSLIGDFKNYMDVCYAPHYRHTHCTSSWVFSHHPTPVMPMFTPGVQTTFGDVHALIVEQLELEAKHDPTWEERPFTSLQWRGQTSGPLWESITPWRTSQRARLHLLSHQEDGLRNITVTDGDDIMHSVEVPNYRVNPLFLDAGMVGPAVQCVEEDGTCDKMFEVFQGYDKRISFDRASLYKYVLDIDGNSWSGRFRRLMMSNAAVVKATIFPEFWTDWAIPWLHFIPMQVDYADMWDIMAFFRGGVNNEGAHDALGKEIALAGKEWVRECYRWADLEAYQFRLMLEYGRLYNDEDEPGSNDFTGDTSVEPRWNGPVLIK